MREAFYDLAEFNLALGAAILVVLFVRRPLRRLFGAGMAYGLWLLPLVAAAATVLPARYVPIPVVAAPLAATPTVTTIVDWVALSSPPALEPSWALQVPGLMMALWVVGATVMAAWLGYLQARFHKALRAGLAGPAVVGVFRPRIVVPADFETRYSLRERQAVMAHEAAHLARRDPQINALIALARCLCWFNPLVHVAARAAAVDQEIACDAWVVRRQPAARRAYAEALLKTQLAAHPLPLGCYWPSGTEHPLLERIAMIDRNDLSRRHRVAGALALGLLCTSAGAAAWAAQPPRTVTPAANTPVQPAVGGLVANPLQAADAGAIPDAATTAYTVRSVRLLPARPAGVPAASPDDPDARMAAIADSVGNYFDQLFVEDFYDRSNPWPNGQARQRHPLPDGMVAEIVTTTTTPDGVTRGPSALVSNAMTPYVRNDGGAIYGGLYAVGSAGGNTISLDRLLAFEDRTVAIEGLQIASGDTVTLALPDGTRTTITATLRRQNDLDTALNAAVRPPAAPGARPPEPAQDLTVYSPFEIAPRPAN